MPLAFEGGVVAHLPQHVADGGDVGRHVRGPGKVGVVKHAGVGRMLAGVHGRARRRAHGVGRVVVDKRDTAGLHPLAIGQANALRHRLVRVLLVGDDEQKIVAFVWHYLPPFSP